MFKTVRKKRKFEVIIDQIKDLLVQKKIKVGQKMPSEVKLAESLEVSRSSLREALKILSFLGMLESKTGEGTIIKEANTDNLSSLMSLIAVSKGLDTSELYELRVILEINAASLAAKRHSTEDLEEIKKYLMGMSRVGIDKETQAEYDHSFHMAISRASKNEMLVMVMGLISGLLQEQIKETRYKLSEDISTIERFHNEHWNIYTAIKDCDAAKAHTETLNHLTRAQQDLGIQFKNE
ncbi:FadR/GntR family transcriptional regulator [Alteribacillus sp. YIM 98480]|uniref:FadR/GntR family transcriptional regulator n=1 Tax=Alteribacillus sp. YIM 98480 TaxID=2606599 RepID=UPI00131CB3DE|nr:FadR/GntR family transcriptional regulator [Alteribacillus sp. YIM 98480]